MIILSTYFKQLVNSSILEHPVQYGMSWFIMSEKRFFFFCLFVLFPFELMKPIKVCSKTNGNFPMLIFPLHTDHLPSPFICLLLFTLQYLQVVVFLNIFCTEFMVAIGRKFGFQIQLFPEAENYRVIFKAILYYLLYY